MKKQTDPFKNLPPFTRALLSYSRKNRTDFDTPGHHSGRYWNLTKEGKTFFHFFHAPMFESDLSDSQSILGDPSSYVGLSRKAEELAARTFHADRTWFVLHGTSTSNRICTQALLAPGDLVLFDRNNHKSVWYGALLQAGATPVFLESERNRDGIIGGLRKDAFKEDKLRDMARKADPQKADLKRPFRLACLQLCTYDGIFSNVRLILKTLGRLCDYILFDCAWAGYEQFIPWMKDFSPLTVPLGPEDPGILVTQSVHKQLAGFSQLSQIHKKDSHIRGQKRYVPDDVFNNAFLMNISTSPYFPFYASLEMNAFIHQKEGQKLWKKALLFSIYLRKAIIKNCHHFRPFVPAEIKGRKWESYSAREISSHKRFFAVSPKDSWHGFSHILKSQYLLDPCKILVICGRHSEIPAPVVSAFLETQGIITEKNDFHTLLFLAEPGDRKEKARVLTAALQRFESFYDRNVPVQSLFPETRNSNKTGLRDFCQGISQMIKRYNVDGLQRRLAAPSDLPQMAMNPRKATEAFVRGNRERVPLSKAEGRIALECALPYPPGICAVCAGEKWTRTACAYFTFFQELNRRYPFLSPEMTGVHQDPRNNSCYVWVYKS